MMFPVLFNRRVHESYESDWAEVPPSGFFAKYIGGIIFPLVCAAYGAWCIVTRHGIVFGDYTSMDVQGGRAIALGIAAISLGLFLHCHCFWGNIYQLGVLATLGKIAGLMGVVGGLGYVIVQVGIWGNA